ncbi:MAG: anti-sigma factor family protein, partial [Planctomycetota bacterium]
MSDRQDQFEQLSAYLDGELDAESARRLEEALAADEELRQELAGLRDTRQLLKQVSMQPAPAHFARDVLRKAERHHHIGRALPGGALRSVRWIPLAAAAVVLLACGFAMVIIANLPPAGTEPIGDLAVAEPLTPPATEILAGADETDDRAAGVAMGDSPEEAVEDVVTEVIYTDDLELAHHQVREVFLTNDLQPVLMSEGLPPVEFVNRQS